MQKKIAIGIASVAAFLFFTILVLFVVDLGFLKGKVEQVASESLGREVQIAGEFHVNLSRYSVVSAENVRIGNADWAVAENFLTADSMSLEFDLWSAFGPPFEIQRLYIKGLSLDIESQEDGSGNWPAGSEATRESESGTPVPSDSLLFEQIIVKDSTLTINGSAVLAQPIDLSGIIAVTLGDEIAVTAELESQLLVLAADAGEEEPGATSEDQGLLFSASTESLDAIRDFRGDISLSLKIDELRDAKKTAARDISLSAAIRPGELRIDPFQASVHGGSISAALAITSTTEAAGVSLRLDGEDVRMADSADTDGEKEPPVDFSIEVEGTGRSPRALATSARGEINVDIDSGRSRQGDVGFLANDILAEMFSALAPDEEEVAFTDVECGVVRATIEDGEVDVGTILIKTSDLVIEGSGKVSLEKETIDIGFNTKAREGLGIAAAGLVTPFIKLGGSLGDPAVTIDAPSALLAGGLAVVTGGVSLLGKEVLDRVVAEAADCSGTDR